jgi:hypothetical protein
MALSQPYMLQRIIHTWTFVVNELPPHLALGVILVWFTGMELEVAKIADANSDRGSFYDPKIPRWHADSLPQARRIIFP